MNTTRTLLALALASLGAGPAPAGLLFFASEAAFDTAAPGLAVHDFSAAMVASGEGSILGSTLDGATNNGIFSPGDILPGLVN